MRPPSFLLPSLVFALVGAGCSFPTDDFRLGGDAAVDRPAPDVVTPPPDVVTPPPDVVTPPPDVVTPPPDVVAPPDDMVVPPADMVVPPADMVVPPPDGGCATNTDCMGGRVCCEGMCVDAQTSNAHCGRCGAVCDPPNGDPLCAMGVCGIGRCDMGFGNCDMNAANGCEVVTATDPTHCGACGTRCPPVGNAAPTCAAGRCGFTCNAGFADCNMNPTDGCEEDLRTSVRACGACGSACVGGAGTSAVCVDRVCTPRCVTGLADCDGNTANGCEVAVSSSVTNCGMCGLACTFPNATALCVGGTCTRGACQSGFGDCDGNMVNGCETDTATSATHCGGCGRACTAGSFCRAGACVTMCGPAPLLMCGAACVDTSATVAHCGGCGRTCAPPNAAGACRGGVCAIGTCAPGFADCDRSALNGCEVNLNSDARNCGGCAAVCSSAGGTPSCTNGACLITCAPGFGNCDNDVSDGCEVSTNTSVNDCGGCGRVCALANATATCTAGSCAVAVCAAGYGNCDGSAANGCETRLNTTTACGSCTTRCATGQFCNGTTCDTLCRPPSVLCAGVCVNVQEDLANCGACGRPCAPRTVCTAGRCVVPPPANDLCANATTIVLTSGSRITLSATAANANHNLDSPCFGVGGADVFFRFTLTRRELVYADTFGATWDTKLFFATSCTAAMTTRTSGDNVCDDNQGLGCTTTALASQVYTVLDPGTYYLVLSSNGTPSSTPIRFEHIPVGGGIVAPLARGTTTRSGTTSGTGTFTSMTCGGTGPENAFWWVTCPDQAVGAFTATTCSRATWNTLLTLVHATTSGTSEACNNDSTTPTCGLQSTLDRVLVPAGAGVHALIVDGFSSGAGSYSVFVTRP